MAPFGQHLARVELIENARDVASRVQFHPQAVVLQQRGRDDQRVGPFRSGQRRGQQRGDRVGRQFAARQQRTARHHLHRDGRAIRALQGNGLPRLPEGQVTPHEAGGVGQPAPRRPAARRWPRAPHPAPPGPARRTRAYCASDSAYTSPMLLPGMISWNWFRQTSSQAWRRLCRGVGVGRVGQPGQRRQDLGVVQQELALAVGALVARLGGVGAAVVFQVKLAVPGGQALSHAGLQVAEEIPHPAKVRARRGGEAAQHLDILQHLARRAAAPIPVPVAHQPRLDHARPPGVLLLGAGPGVEHLVRRGHGVVGGGVLAPRLVGGAEVRQHARAVQPLPPEGFIRKVVVLAPADLDGEEVFQPGLLDELRQVPGVAEHVRQPQHRAFSARPKMGAEEAAPQQELARQRLAAREVAIRLHPHPAQRLPVALRRAPAGYPRTAPGRPGG